jgi:glutamate 5-kinase
MIIQFAGDRARVALARRVVVKLGTSTVTRPDGSLAHGRFYALADSLAAVRRSGRELVVVTSGAVALGGARLRGRPEGSPASRQARAAVGQARLMALYADAFDRNGITAAQMLAAPRDVADRRRARALRSTLCELLALGVLPIVNANDAVLPEEPAPTLVGENDRLAALVARAVRADLLLMLTDVDGVFDGDPRGPGMPRLLERIEDVGPDLEAAAGGPRQGTGGMRAKLEAARLAARGGCTAVIANGAEPRVVERLLKGERLGTLFPAAPRRGLVLRPADERARSAEAR